MKMAKLKLKGLLLKGAHTLLVRHVPKKVTFKGKGAGCRPCDKVGGQSSRPLDKAGWLVSPKIFCSPSDLTLV